jgi:hypothetical protein
MAVQHDHRPVGGPAAHKRAEKGGGKRPLHCPARTLRPFHCPDVWLDALSVWTVYVQQVAVLLCSTCYCLVSN